VFKAILCGPIASANRSKWTLSMNARSNTDSGLYHAGGEALPPRRRQYSTAFKLQVLREIMRPGASIAAVALRHNMNCNVMFRWRREYRVGELVSDEPLERPPADDNPFIAVGVIDDRGAVAMLPPPEKDDDKQAPPVQRRSRIEIIMPNGVASVSTTRWRTARYGVCFCLRRSSHDKALGRNKNLPGVPTDGYAQSVNTGVKIHQRPSVMNDVRPSSPPIWRSPSGSRSSATKSSQRRCSIASGYGGEQGRRDHG